MQRVATRTTGERSPDNVRTLTGRAPILLAEDDNEMRRLIASTLREDGYQIVEASNGFELLDRIEAAIAWGGRFHPPISLIVMDVRMPGMTGLDVLAILRCAYWATPVILVTAFADAETRSEAQELGAAAVLEKPFELDVLRATVRKTLRRSSAGSERNPDGGEVKREHRAVRREDGR